MKIALTTNQPLSFFGDCSSKPLGAGGQIQLHYLAKYLAKHADVSVIQSKSGETQDGVSYLSYDQANTYDVVIGYCVPEVTRWVNAKIRLVSIQNDNHWLPVNPDEFVDIDKIVLVGECLYDHYSKYIDTSRLACIGNGYEELYCYPDEGKRGKRSICFSAAPTHSSGLHVALQALSLLNETLAFHIYGTMELWSNDLHGNQFTPDDEYETLLQSLIASSPCEVIVHGSLPYTVMLSEYTKHSIMLHPKTHETFGCSLIEAMASGVVPIASNVNACLDRIEHGITGFNCQYDSPEGFAEKLDILLSDDDKRFAMSLACQVYAKQYTFDEIAKRWMQLIEQLLY